MQQRGIEIAVGLFVVVAGILLLFLALKVSGFSYHTSKSAYQISAEFDNIGGLKAGAPLRIAGVKIGEVESIALDPQTFRARVKVTIFSNDTKIPVDSTLSILTEGILGAQYLSLSPGFSDQNLTKNGSIQTTHSALILENLIGQFLFKTNKKGA